MKYRLFCLVFALNCLVLFGGDIDWDKAQTVQTGVKLVRCEKEQPRLQKIYVMRIDLQTKGLHFTAMSRDPDWGKPMPDHEKTLINTKRTRTRNFLLNARKSREEGGLGLNMIVAANAAPWSPWEKPFNHKYGFLAGLNIVDGEVISDNPPHKAIFVVYKNGKADIVSTIPEKDYKKVEMAVSGFAIILKNGEILMKDDNDLHPRLGYGLSRNRRYMYIVTVEGRQKDWSIGASVNDVAALLKDAGADDGVNMDGGGSTTLYYWNEKEGRPVTLVRHNKDGYERQVASNIGIFLMDNR